MATISLEFAPEFEPLVLSGRKVCTSRRHMRADPGDVFKVRGWEFEVVAVHPLELRDVARSLFVPEGFDCPEDFRACWRRLHLGIYHPKDLVTVHWFRCNYCAKGAGELSWNMKPDPGEVDGID